MITEFLAKDVGAGTHLTGSYNDFLSWGTFKAMRRNGKLIIGIYITLSVLPRFSAFFIVTVLGGKFHSSPSG